MTRYERTVGKRKKGLKKRKRVENEARACVAQSLLNLSESYNGLEYCEPYCGTATSTTMTIKDIESLERKNGVVAEEESALVVGEL